MVPPHARNEYLQADNRRFIPRENISMVLALLQLCIRKINKVYTKWWSSGPSEVILGVLRNVSRVTSDVRRWNGMWLIVVDVFQVDGEGMGGT